MNAEELDRIERGLGLKLPEAYRRTMLAYPLHAMHGNDFGPLFDHAEDVLHVNRRLREEADEVRPWPSHYLFVGRDEDREGDFILDLSHPDLRVLLMRSDDPERAAAHAPSFVAWVRDLIREGEPWQET